MRPKARAKTGSKQPSPDLARKGFLARLIAEAPPNLDSGPLRGLNESVPAFFCEVENLISALSNAGYRGFEKELSSRCYLNPGKEQGYGHAYFR